LILLNSSLDHLVAQCGETLFLMMRPLASAQDASLALTRLLQRPSAGMLDVGLVKRRDRNPMSRCPDADSFFAPMSSTVDRPASACSDA
jgi:protein ImuA